MTSMSAKANAVSAVNAKLNVYNQAEIEIEIYGEGFVGVDIFRTDVAGGEYQYLATINNETANEIEYGGYFSGYDYKYKYTDPTVMSIYQTFYYQVKEYVLAEDGVTKIYVAGFDTSVVLSAPAPVITTACRVGKNSAHLEWTTTADADGYLVYCYKDYDDESRFLGTYWINDDTSYYYMDDANQEFESRFELMEDISGTGAKSLTYSGLTNGVTYTYRIMSYKMVNGVQMFSNKAEVAVMMDYYATATESYDQRIKRAFGSEKKMKKNFKSAKKAAKQMKTIRIKVWDFKNGKKGKKVTRIKFLTVNKRMAPTVKQMFKEIYESSEKQVIHDIGCYSYRAGQHMYGLAIDVNPNENYMIDGKKVMAGHHWKPKKDPYSIPKDCQFVRIMYRYGFIRGEWGNRKDYMHFSYFGT